MKMTKINRMILKGANDAGMLDATLVCDGNHQKLIGTVNGTTILILRVPCTPGRGDEKLVWKQARDTVRRAIARNEFTRAWNC